MKCELSKECGHIEALEMTKNCSGNGFKVKVYGEKLMECVKQLEEFERSHNGVEGGTVICHGPGPKGECQPYIEASEDMKALQSIEIPDSPPLH